ncbi:MAG: GNAT family N-acetyltransferase [Fuerstiella sp.]
MATRIIRPFELTAHERSVWRSFLRQTKALKSPFFLPEFALAVGEVNPAARVIVVEEDGHPTAFLPLQFADHGEPVALGGSLNDYQGLIAAPDFRDAATEVLSAAGLSRFFCTKLLDWSSSFKDDVVAVRPSPYIDLSEGYAAWESGLGSGRQLKQMARKERKLIREHGRLRFEFHEPSAAVLRTLIDWKRRQYVRSGEHDVLADGWPPQLLKRLLTLPDDCPLQPVLSTLYAGGKLVAAHYGLTGLGVFHCWFPVYNADFHRYSPGKLLLRHMLFHAPEYQLTRFDFGAGDEPYKYSFANAESAVCRIIIDRNRTRRWLRSRYYQLRMRLKQSEFGPRFKALRMKLRGRTPPPREVVPDPDSRSIPAQTPAGSASPIEITS